MKIFALSDFHGKFPEKLQKKIRKIGPDLIISPGDFCGNNELIRLFFKHAFAKEIELWEVIGKKKTKELELKSLNAGLRVIKKLNSFNIPVIAVEGNYDPGKYEQIGNFRKHSNWKFLDKNLFTPKIKKFRNFDNISYKSRKFNDFVFIGYPKSSYPGVIIGRKIKEEKGSSYERLKLKKRLNDQKTYAKWLDKLFKNAKKTGKKVIFLCHNVPYNTKLDKIRSRDADKRVKGEHYGDYITRQFILKYKPLLCICGHMHENQGKCKLGKTVIINAGPVYGGKAALIELQENKIKKIKFFH